MAKQIHKGSELINVSETWEENERKRQEGSLPAREEPVSADTGNTELDRVVREEAAAYDQENKEDKLLGGDRATVNDDADGPPGDA